MLRIRLKNYDRLQKKSSEAGPVVTGQFRIVFVLVGLLPLLPVLGCLRFTESNGAEVSGHEVPASR